ncbi:hypothetical protein V6N13_114932 [Hibiscus sabdariffa]
MSTIGTNNCMKSEGSSEDKNDDGNAMKKPTTTSRQEGLNALERSGSPMPQAVQPLQKRGRGLEEAMLIDDEPINEETKVRVLDGGGQQLKDAAGGMSESPIPSFKDKLLGDKGVSSNVRLLTELDVDVREDDVRVGGCS